MRLISFTFTARNGAGSISVPGLKVGDHVIWDILGSSPGTWESPGATFEHTITVNDQIQQIDPSNLSTYSATIIIVQV